MVPVKILPEAIFSDVHINKHIEKLEDATRFYYYLSLSCTFMSMVICILEAVEMVHHNNYLCDKAKKFLLRVYNYYAKIILTK